MREIFIITAATCGIVLLLVIILLPVGRCGSMPRKKSPEIIKLPEPQYDSKVSIEKTLLKRRSVRNYLKVPLTLNEISQLLWAAQGMTSPSGYRTAPSAGALYPLEVYVVAGSVENLPIGIYKYKSSEHEIIKTGAGDLRAKLCQAALSQSSINNAPVVLVFCAVYKRTTKKYGERGIRYVHIEVGHAAQNVCLQAVALDLGALVIGAFQDNEVKQVMNIAADEHPLYILPIGK